MLTNLPTAILLGLVAGAISCTISKAKVFAWLRAHTQKRSPWLAALFSCYYCTSHWVALFLTLIYRPVLFDAWLPVDVLVTAMFVTCVSAITASSICALVRFNPDGTVA